MDRIVECVPNFSEGRNQTTVRALVNAVESVPGVWLLDHTMDRDHHRSVLSFAGEPDAVAEAAFRAIRVATDLIDLRKHKGVHPRVGATDVVPFVPVLGATMQDCIHLAKRLGQQVGAELEIPVFLYEQAAIHCDHAPLESVRRGGLQGLAFRMASDPDWTPDFGPPELHKTAGAIVIGARPPLIAFNVNLRSTDLALARSIAKDIRQSNGGLPHLKAIGVKLASRQLVQVAMNLTDYMITPIHVAFEAVRTRAAEQGVAVTGSEVIGLVPQAALVQAAAHSLALEQFNSTQVLETRLETRLLDEPARQVPSRKQEPVDLQSQSLADFLDAVAAATPIPAGATVAALVGALAASLGIMGARLSQQRGVEHRLSEIGRRLRELMQADGDAYQRFIRASRLAKTDRTRPAVLSSALHLATEIPLEIAEQATEAGALLHACSAEAKPRVRSDLTVGLVLAIAAADAGRHTVAENINIQHNQRLKSSLLDRIQLMTNRLEELRVLCYTAPLGQGQAGTRRKPIQASPGKVHRREEWKLKSSIITSRKLSKLPRRNSRGKGSSVN
ncbi:MAG: glutamate formimidoyltransferase [Nitrospirae bacterium]|nr:glutamate formimidoyltransferase [Nitrospirota bacterium]MDE3050206.1 glutamate formimidoyltransferase [Nitrospirota bacterium]MDE3219976.1 glutamate formimidoyltransferase [Nitrospirota bacterium]